MSASALMSALELQAELLQDDLNKRIAAAYTVAFRGLLKPHNLKRHPVMVRDYCGTNVLYVGDTIFFELRNRHPLVNLLWLIGDVIDNNADLARHLKGVSLES